MSLWRVALIVDLYHRCFFILLFALYVQFHGDFGPGGGFQAGVMFAAAFILHGMVGSIKDTEKAASMMLMEKLVSLGVLLYAGVGFACLLKGGNFLEYNVFDHGFVPDKGPYPNGEGVSPYWHGQHLGILLVELGVGVTVTSAMLSMFYKFANRGRP